LDRTRRSRSGGDLDGSGSSPGRRSPCCPSNGWSSAQTAVALAATLAVHAPVAEAAKVSECTKIGICYCVEGDSKATIATKVERFRQVLAEQRKMGKAVGYLSVPLTRRAAAISTSTRKSPKTPSRRSRSGSAPTTCTCSIPERSTPTCRRARAPITC
jgi:hypothetical protein